MSERMSKSNRLQVFLLLAIAAPTALAAREMFLISDGAINWRNEVKGPPTAAEIQVIEGFGKLPAFEAIRRLGYVLCEASTHDRRELALDGLTQVEGWQEELESIVLEAKAAWDTREDERGGPVFDIRGMQGTHWQVWSMLDEIANRGVIDAVLIAAPFLFDPLDYKIYYPDSTVSGQASRLMSTATALAGVPTVSQGPELITSRREARLPWCRWWVSNARKFGAEPPSSEDAPFEEVLELCRAARRTRPNARFKRVVSATAASTAQPPPTEKTSPTPRSAETAPLPAAPAKAASSPTVQDAGAETTRWHRWWPAALIPLIILVIFFSRRRSPRLRP